MHLKKIIIISYLFFTSIVYSQKLITSHREKFYVYQEKDKTYTVKDGENKIKYKGLKYANNAGRGLQILTGENKTHFLDNDKNLSFITEPKNEELLYCGTVQNFATKIIETKDEYHIINYNYGYSDYLDKNIKAKVTNLKVSKKNIIDTCCAFRLS